MSKDLIISGTWKSGSNTVAVRLPLITFQEEDACVAYCPALDLSGYGDSEEEAKVSYETVLSEYLKYTINKKSLASDLESHGWRLKKNLRKGAIPPTMEQMLKNNEDFNRIFNTHDFKKTESVVSIPSF